MEHFARQGRHFLLQIVISVAQYEVTRNNGKTKIIGKESLSCPVCGGKLSVHGTCVRKVRYTNGVEILQLRVMKCRDCGKTHRELPEFVVPYKRNSLNLLCEIAEAPEDSYPCETSTWLRVKAWIAWFFSYARNVWRGLCVSDPTLTAAETGGCLRQQLMHFVRLVVNSGNWVQHRSAVTNLYGASILAATDRRRLPIWT